MTELDISSWKEEAIQKQSFYCKYLCENGEDTLESYSYENNDIIHLKNKLGFILFGDPKFSNENKSNGNQENEKTSENSSGITHSNIQSNDGVSGVVGSTDEKDESFCENNFTDDNIEFLVELLDAPVIDLDNMSSLVQQDSHYYRQYVKLIFGHDLEDDLINNIEADLEEMYSGELVDSMNSETNPTPTLPNQNHSSSSSQDDDGKDEGFIFYYSDPKQIKQIDHILKQIEACSGPDFRDKGLFLSFIFVIAKIEDNIGEFPVIRVVQSNKNQSGDISYFIDITGRCYEGWNKFLEDNIFPSCTYCYPKNGFYTYDADGNVLVEFGESPESKVLRKATHIGDIASNIASLGCATVAVASLLCPVAAPILIGTSGVGLASGLWSSGRSIYELVDRKLHKQDLGSREAVGSWIGAATGIFSVASMGALNYAQNLAKNGRVIGKTANCVINGIEVTNTGLNGVNIGHQIYNMYEERDFNVQSSVNLALSLLFFYHSAMKFKTAKQIFVESQKDVINNIENQLSRRQRKAFKKIVRGTTEANLMEGNARVIKTVINLEDPKSYFQGISKVAKAAQKTKSKLAFSEDTSGKIKINGKVEAQPDVINSLSSRSKKKMFNSSRKWHQNEKYYKLFKKDMKLVSKKENLIFKKNTHELLKKISLKNKQDIKINSGKPTNVKVMKDINNFFNIMKRDKNYEKINSEVKSEAKKSPSEFNLFILCQNMLKLMEKYDEGKKIYDISMKYYEDNLKDFFEEFIKDVSEHLDKIFNETNENLRTVKRIFYSNELNRNELTPWNYFEIYFPKLFNIWFNFLHSVPDPDSVIILPQKAGWLYLLGNDCTVRCVFIAPLRINPNLEKIWVHAFIKNS